MESTFSDAGWDFNTPVWTIDEGLDYPRLWWENVDPIELLDVLWQEIIDLELEQGIENSLLAKLETALQKLEDDNENNDTAVINILEAFINTVDVLRGINISEEDADCLISAAQTIIDILTAQ